MCSSGTLDNKLSKNFLIVVIVVCCILIVFLATGFVMSSNEPDNVVKKEKNGGNLVLNYSGNTDGLTITNVVPTSDIVGMANNIDGSYFDFSVDVDLDKAKSIDYELSISKVSSNCTIPDNDIKVYLEKMDKGVYSGVFGPKKFVGLEDDSSLGTVQDSMILVKTSKNESGSDKYRLRMWLAGTSLVTSGSYSVEVNIVGKAK